MEAVERGLGNQILGQPQRDYNHADDSQYRQLRDQAQKEQDQAQKLSHQSQTAFQSGDKAEAHQLSEQAKQHRSKAEDLNVQAAQWVFRANNADSGPDEIDLHGLFVKESLSALDARIHAGQQRGESVLKVITGKGIHSQSHVSKLKPAVEEYCDKNGLKWQVDQKNTGVVVVQLGQAQAQGYAQPHQAQQAQGYSQPQQGHNQGYYQNQNQNQGYNQNYNQNQNQNYNQNYQNQGYNQNQNYNQNNNQNNNQDLVKKIKMYINIFKQIKRALQGCL